MRGITVSNPGIRSLDYCVGLSGLSLRPNVVSNAGLDANNVYIVAFVLDSGSRNTIGCSRSAVL